ncbi:MAG: MBOAT family protein [Akkermansia sp.]|nr:MBOAT family protein [Akkermansia sp.]
MNFVTLSFVLFFLPVLCLGWSIRRFSGLYKWFLIAAGLVFYGCAGPTYLSLLLGIAVLNWGTAAMMPRIPKKAGRTFFISLNVILHILILTYFKYYEFLVLNLISFADIVGWDFSCLFSDALADIVLPVGLSFYTFQGLSYSIDHYRNPELEPRSFMDVLAYVSFFPTILSGPILRENDFFPQLQNNRTADASDFTEGMAYIISGLFKKVVLASYLSEHLVDGVFTTPQDYTSLATLVGVYAYTIQIFCDFSGYTDLAIGVARLMGFRLPPNFKSPYKALDLQEFWHRWHITLSTWLRDYLYIPMGGSRRGNRYFNLFMTMLIGGMWHGSGLTFLIWGALHGMGLAVVHGFKYVMKLIVGQARVPAIISLPAKGLSWVLTIHFVAFLWIFFRAESWESAVQVIERICALDTEGNGFTLMIIIAIACGLVIQWIGPALFRVFTGIQARLPWVLQAVVVALLCGLIMNMGPDGTLPFIYFNF